ncbi:hypothetical protein QT199_005905 [Xanthomonas phaseoli pv. phaseoli]|uniref:hypothetical protein n=2 Tax=Xanthomonas TaxID=338 RepID=UPI001F25D354|nr:hypothetical protein [Xanthomonas phaseoli]MDM4799983.1 hypothetical protein [Xanthomonas phaseoli pv. phaseoli]MDM4804591.1 hypothetical protein [Xanthomonas phaseoli pv. phaseoli]MDM4810467.1 hypothetical protein [Xanthomonas phaseoli pv. phaseoli]UZB12123.1 hypothetical protein OM952_20790 [Xanthomonas phaseoli pv. phaseoli]UZB16272.1 hypothetical protein OM949_20395 [Xanthomonas phaseoli pv. phaseoli]
MFETFCAHHRLDCQRIAETSSRTPDYHVWFGSTLVAVEIKQIESDRGIDPDGVWSRTIGWHVRQKIVEARGQLRAAAGAGVPAVLLIYNTVDPFQLFGTEQHDFLSAMYGELTVRVDTSGRAASGPFHGRNAALRENFNTSFSGVGHLRETCSGAEVIIYENVFAAHPLPFGDIPDCITAVRVELNRTDLHHADRSNCVRARPGATGVPGKASSRPGALLRLREVRPQTHPAVRA